ncbi:MAG: hypothetical protein AB8B56_14175 [Crocinitomicaceae bacterium]
MKKSQSLFLAGLCLSLTFTSFSQTENTNKDLDDGLCTRWHSVKNSEENAALFAALPELFKEVKRQSENNVLFATRELTEVGPLLDENGDPVFLTTEDGESNFIFQEKTITTVQTDVPLVDDKGDFIVILNDDGSQSFIFPDPVITTLNADVPLSDQNGNPKVVTLGNGNNSFVYADQVSFTVQPKVHGSDELGNITAFPYGDPQSYKINEQAISELHIIESRKHYDAHTGEYSDDFHVSRMGLCMNPSATQQERIWIDLLSFFDNMENPEENAFYQLLSERNFKGFQYKQTECK